MAVAPIVAVVPVRAGAPAPGGIEVAVRAAGAGGRVLLVGDDPAVAAVALSGLVGSVDAAIRTDPPGAWAPALAAVLEPVPTIALPAAPDGRDLAPALAAHLDRPLVAGVLDQDGDAWVTSRIGGLAQQALRVDGPVVVTLQGGLGLPERRGDDVPEVHPVALVDPGAPAPVVEVLEILPPDPATMDLAEASRIVGAGAGLMVGDDATVAGRMALLGRVGEALGASMGATRVVTDAGWVDHERQIGTTGVVVDPRLYLAFAVSGAVQHTAGLGHPEHIISVNLDPHCPMMELADLAVVADANATLEALAERLGVGTTAAAGEAVDA